MAYIHIIYIVIYIITLASSICKAEINITQIKINGLYEKAFIDEYGSNTTLDQTELKLLLERVAQQCAYGDNLDAPEGETEPPEKDTVSSECNNGTAKCEHKLKVFLYLNINLPNYTPLSM